MRSGLASVMAAMMLTTVGLLVAVEPVLAQGLFARAQDFPPETQPDSLSTADFDGDDVVDLAVTNFDSNQNLNASNLLGNGDSTFQAPEAYAAGSGTAFVGASDLNGDEKPDLATVNASSNDVSILLNVAPPQVSSVDPTSAFRGNTVTLSVNGAAFGSGAKARPNQGNLSLGASSVTRDSATRLTAEITIPNSPAGSTMWRSPTRTGAMGSFRRLSRSWRR